MHISYIHIQMYLNLRNLSKALKTPIHTPESPRECSLQTAEAKGIIGEGLLSLPAGLAAGTGIVSGILIALVFYVVMMPGAVMERCLGFLSGVDRMYEGLLRWGVF